MGINTFMQMNADKHRWVRTITDGLRLLKINECIGKFSLKPTILKLTKLDRLY